ncbi:hypothetical protein M427DRAFT_45570 [Gonapodya prolifera JEL478]|uniref:Uncharacterized protein n=1 Tax=Gonapodya prolifera (strain JEL478) TaxID=1344416 RepID=A0A139AA12_GONPJ|nr:hypothetical protein M427DRAFT_45570 [Gonapodya prolifera JEL478]|eukprot:KXS13626.1 hypothetical protein M427DRAFT_45570 [Gonapodya prolifera JEL478]
MSHSRLLIRPGTLRACPALHRHAHLPAFPLIALRRPSPHHAPHSHSLPTLRPFARSLSQSTQSDSAPAESPYLTYVGATSSPIKTLKRVSVVSLSVAISVTPFLSILDFSRISKAAAVAVGLTTVATSGASTALIHWFASRCELGQGNGEHGNAMRGGRGGRVIYAKRMDGVRRGGRVFTRSAWTESSRGDIISVERMGQNPPEPNDGWEEYVTRAHLHSTPPTHDTFVTLTTFSFFAFPRYTTCRLRDLTPSSAPFTTFTLPDSVSGADPAYIAAHRSFLVSGGAGASEKEKASTTGKANSIAARRFFAMEEGAPEEFIVRETK